ncbi:uncharacterized protein N7482_010292 [Penicillium canariense]|uniref:Uncharacterized protein n=1 Tax=Penicillium canariense TaxID=189055 RepID=A0A9W9LEC6_9EURO|nr:uncharacterized protein N7482_010292 [Penicillium canariense]KAJ5151040.1 hypothetical protein N7482_010292 [Penicillium canariense]
MDDYDYDYDSTGYICGAMPTSMSKLAAGLHGLADGAGAGEHPRLQGNWSLQGTGEPVDRRARNRMG